MEHPAATGRLAGKVAIVTGGGTRSDTQELGIGRATALLFARAGAQVVVADLSVENAQRTCDDIVAEGGDASVVAADVSDAAACQAMVSAAVERFGALHVLFNNAAVVGNGTVLTFEDENFDRNVAVNLKGPALATRYAIPAMERSCGGSIIYVSSIDGIAAPYSQTVPYSPHQGCAAHARQDHGIQSRTPGHSRQLHRAGPRTRCLPQPADEAGSARAPQERIAPRHRRHALGRGVAGRVPGQRRVALDIRGDDTGRWRPARGGAAASLRLPDRHDGVTWPSLQSAVWSDAWVTTPAGTDRSRRNSDQRCVAVGGPSSSATRSTGS